MSFSICPYRLPDAFVSLPEEIKPDFDKYSVLDDCAKLPGCKSSEYDAVYFESFNSLITVSLSGIVTMAILGYYHRMEKLLAWVGGVFLISSSFP